MERGPKKALSVKEQEIANDNFRKLQGDLPPPPHDPTKPISCAFVNRTSAALALWQAGAGEAVTERLRMRVPLEPLPGNRMEATVKSGAKVAVDIPFGAKPGAKVTVEAPVSRKDKLLAASVPTGGGQAPAVELLVGTVVFWTLAGRLEQVRGCVRWRLGVCALCAHV